MWYGLALLMMFVVFVTARGELPIYMGFLIPQGSAATPPGIEQQAAAATGTLAQTITQAPPLTFAGPGATGLIN